MRFVLAMLSGFLCGQAAAQDALYKCKDAANRITYSSKECKQLGLESAGEIKDRVVVTPAIKPPPPRPVPPPASQPTAAAKTAAPAAANDPDAKDAAANPERRCFTVKNAKGGTSTRCNDVPPPE